MILGRITRSERTGNQLDGNIISVVIGVVIFKTTTLPFSITYNMLARKKLWLAVLQNLPMWSWVASGKTQVVLPLLSWVAMLPMLPCRQCCHLANVANVAMLPVLPAAAERDLFRELSSVFQVLNGWRILGFNEPILQKKRFGLKKKKIVDVYSICHRKIIKGKKCTFFSKSLHFKYILYNVKTNLRKNLALEWHI